MKALVLGGFAHMDTETKQQYWTEVTVPVYVAPSCVITCFVYVLPENGLWRHNRVSHGCSDIFPS